MKTRTQTRDRKVRSTVKSPTAKNVRSAKSPLDPQFVAAAKASKKKFAPLFKRLPKT